MIADSGEVIGMVSLTEDITDRNLAEQNAIACLQFSSIGSCIDISDRIASEPALRARAEELSYLTTVLAQTNIVLEKRNCELNQFAYVASDEIANLCEWIKSDLEDRLTEDTRH